MMGCIAFYGFMFMLASAALQLQAKCMECHYGILQMASIILVISKYNGRRGGCCFAFKLFLCAFAGICKHFFLVVIHGWEGSFKGSINEVLLCKIMVFFNNIYRESGHVVDTFGFIMDRE